MEVNYAFTVKKNNCYPSVADYEDWCIRAANRGFKIDCFYYELDDTDHLHIHGVARGRSKFFVNSIRGVGWHIKLVEIQSLKDAGIWSAYIQKHWVSEDLTNQWLYCYMVRHGYVDFI